MSLWKPKSTKEAAILMIASIIKTVNNLAGVINKLNPDVRNSRRISTIKGILQNIANEISLVKGK